MNVATCSAPPIGALVHGAGARNTVSLSVAVTSHESPTVLANGALVTEIVAALAPAGASSAAAKTATAASRRVRMSDPRDEEDDERERRGGEPGAAASGEGGADAE